MTLTVYKASAGSGKTHLLTYHYLFLVFSDPVKYKHILAVTFTNKATAEMKERIVSELYKLSKGNDSAMKEMLRKDLPMLNEDGIRLRAQMVLKNILYDYSSFSISTIDSFFQRVIRSFAREAGIKYGYNVELDTEMVLSRAIDLMLDDLGKDKELTQWLLDFTFDQLLQGKGFNLKRNIEKLSGEILKEHFQIHSHILHQKLKDKAFLTDYLRDLNTIIHVYEANMKKWATRALTLINAHGLSPGDFKFGTTSFAQFFKKIVSDQGNIPGPRFIKAYNNPEEWGNPAQKDLFATIRTLYDEGLNDLIGEILKCYENGYKGYVSARSIRNYLYILGILTDISDKLSSIRQDENMLLISDVNVLLKTIIWQNDTPFIYEKTGSRYEHFLIDEFQDTSGFQWDNLKPLVKNSLDSGMENLIVGDVKQSIYRWRSGDWKLLLSKLYQDIPGNITVTKSLATNWRSEEHIVNFNNELFGKIPEVLQQSFLSGLNEEHASLAQGEFMSLMKDAYADVFQSLPVKKQKGKGFAEGYFLPDKDGEGLKWKEQAGNLLANILDDLLSRGFSESDLCILVRTYADGRDIASALLKKGKYRIISKESLNLDASLAVRIQLAVMRYLARPDDLINLANLIMYLSDLKGERFDLTSLLAGNNPAEELEKTLPSFIRNGELDYYSLIELSEKINEKLGLHEISADLAYLQAFQDAIMEYSNTYSPDLFSFLDWWNEAGFKKSVQIPEEVDGIRIMTIHKSKGLDFRVVLIPYCNWKTDHEAVHENVVWCGTSVDPFRKLDIFPLKYSSKLASSHFASDYFTEKLYTFLDNVNALYVAFTRAVEGLVFIAPKYEKGEVKDMAGLIQKALDTNKDYLIYGEKPEKVATVVPSVRSVSLNRFACYPKDLSVSVKWDAENALQTSDHKRVQVNYGKLMHEILARTKFPADFDQNLQELMAEGKVNSEEKEKMSAMFERMNANPLVQEWYMDKWEVRTESPVIVRGGRYKIPDRILFTKEEVRVIDFKFGEPHPHHLRQVREYLNLMQEMGYINIRGYLYYAEKDNVVEV